MTISVRAKRLFAGAAVASVAALAGVASPAHAVGYFYLDSTDTTTWEVVTAHANISPYAYGQYIEIFKSSDDVNFTLAAACRHDYAGQQCTYTYCEPSFSTYYFTADLTSTYDPSFPPTTTVAPPADTIATNHYCIP